MEPSKGRIVMVGIHPTFNNGDDTCPAIITRVNGGGTVNVRALPDHASEVQWRTSLRLFDTEEEARAHGLANAAFWPARV